MTAGFDLKEGKYDKSVINESDVRRMIQPFFNDSSKKDSTYKYTMFQAIVDSIEYASQKTYKITFDQLYLRFSEIYWVLVHKHRIPQKISSNKAPKTLAEKIIEDTVEKYHIQRKTDFRTLPNSIKFEIVQQMKRKCSRYVIGALYADTNKIMYSFSKQKEWVKLNPIFVDYVRKYKKQIQMNNFQAWARFYVDIAAIDNKDVGYYQRLLKREFNNYYVEDISRKVVKNSDVRKSHKGTSKKQNEYDVNIAKRVRKVLMQYPDLGLYLAQICEIADSDKETVRNILEKSFWSRNEGSRYYYNDISDTDIIEEAILSKQEGNVKKEKISEEIAIDEEKLKLLDDPEQLIRQLKKERGITKAPVKDKSSDVSTKQSVSTSITVKKNWDREEVVILVTEYFRTKGLSSKEIDESHRKISEFLRRREEMRTGVPVDSIFRNYAGIRMQSMRIQCLDPESVYTGMQGTKLQKEVVQDYLREPDKLMNEAKRIVEKYSE